MANQAGNHNLKLFGSIRLDLVDISGKWETELTLVNRGGRFIHMECVQGHNMVHGKMGRFGNY